MTKIHLSQKWIETLKICDISQTPRSVNSPGLLSLRIMPLPQAFQTFARKTQVTIRVWFGFLKCQTLLPFRDYFIQSEWKYVFLHFVWRIEWRKLVGNDLVIGLQFCAERHRRSDENDEAAVETRECFYRIRAMIPAGIAFIFDREYSHEWQIHLNILCRWISFSKNARTVKQPARTEVGLVTRISS